MYMLYSTLDLTNCRDAAVWAVVCVAFWGCCRLGELLPTNQVSFHPSHHVTRGEEVMLELNDNGKAHSTGFHIPWSKVTKEEGADICVSEPEPGISTQYAMRQHLHANKNVPLHVSLFAYETDTGGHHNLTKTEYLAWNIASDAGDARFRYEIWAPKCSGNVMKQSVWGAEQSSTVRFRSGFRSGPLDG
ncbi:hypothetical protein B0H10DRAFT_1938483 [Mycena sp. CBHHK59/15]|nr:hypothetical protein B0H10DRAFT_1938483 [Mycena sp. CBHHK59/15]